MSATLAVIERLYQSAFERVDNFDEENNRLISLSSLLNVACSNSCFDTVFTLLERGANVNERVHENLTPLHQVANSISNNSCRIGEILLKNGADVTCKVRFGCTALRFAVRSGNIALVKMLIAHGSAVAVDLDDYGSTLLHATSTISGNTSSSIVMHLVNHGALLEARDRNGRTALHLACSVGNKMICLLLIRLGSDVNAKTCDGWSSLYWAVCIGNFEIVKVLIESKANPNEKTKNGETLLYSCLSSLSWPHMAKILLENGADINARNGFESKHFLIPHHPYPYKPNPYNLSLISRLNCTSQSYSSEKCINGRVFGCSRIRVTC